MILSSFAYRAGIILYFILQGYLFFMAVTILLNWFPGFNNSKAGYIMNKITNFYLGRFRGVFVIGFLDLTPLIGFGIYEFALQMMYYYIIPIL